MNNRVIDEFVRPEPLEPRRLLSASPLLIEGTDAADVVRVRQTASVLWVTRNGSLRVHRAADVSEVVVEARGGNDLVLADASVRLPVTVYAGEGDDQIRGGREGDALHGQGGADRILGGPGDDRLYGGPGADHVMGGDGDDVLVTLGGGGGEADNDTLAGNAGRDNFWADAAAAAGGAADTVADLAAGDFRHAVGSFMSYTIRRSSSNIQTIPVPTELAGQELADPLASSRISGWADISGGPLFASSGISEHDIDQNGAHDCYFLASLSAIAKLRPAVITDRLVDLGDGTYAVHFLRAGQDVFVRVDGDVPVDASGAPFYAGLGVEGSVWGAVIEKAFAFFRKEQGTYASLDWGNIATPFEILGQGAISRLYEPDGFDRRYGGLLEGIDHHLAAGHAVLYNTHDVMPAGAKLLQNHVLMVDRVVRDVAGKAVSLVLRDPHKDDGAAPPDGADDGYITVTAAEAFAWIEKLTWCDW